MSEVVIIDKDALRDLKEHTVARAVRHETAQFTKDVKEISDMMLLQKDFLTRREAMRYLDVSPDTLKGIEAQGLQYRQIGRKKFYAKAELKRFIEAAG